MDGHTPTGLDRFEVVAKVDTHFSWIRTRMSLERTLMSWVRTGTALIAFGFTIFQFLENFNRMPGVAPAAHPYLPQVLGLTLIGGGIAALVIAAYQYIEFSNYLWHEKFRPVAGIRETPGRSPLLALTMVLVLAGIFAFLAVAFRLR
jgi:putative membrane protein